MVGAVSPFPSANILKELGRARNMMKRDVILRYHVTSEVPYRKVTDCVCLGIAALGVLGSDMRVLRTSAERIPQLLPINQELFGIGERRAHSGIEAGLRTYHP